MNTLVLRTQLEGVLERGYRILSGCEDAVAGGVWEDIHQG